MKNWVKKQNNQDLNHILLKQYYYTLTKYRLINLHQQLNKIINIL